MSRRPISRSADLRRLQEDGYTLSLAGGKLVVRDVPWVDSARAVHPDGVLVMPLTLAGDVAQPPDTHTASFAGGIPCDASGAELNKIINGRDRSDLGDSVHADCSCSMKPLINDGRYLDYYEKVTKYVAAISGHAVSIDPTVTAQVHRPVPATDEDAGPFRYLDTASSRAGIDAINERLASERLAIVGLGGTGEYLLDFASKSRVAEIHTFDADRFLTHNAFRGPGAPSLAELDAAPLKVNHFFGIYDNMRTGIVAHPYAITAANVERLRDMTFVFIAIDDAPAKEPVVTALLNWGIPFIDVGMGVTEINGTLTAVLRTTIATPEQHDHAGGHIKFVDTGYDGDYRSNIQIAELNARNAADAIIRWKKYRGIYADLTFEHSSSYTVATNHIVNEELANPSIMDRGPACA